MMLKGNVIPNDIPIYKAGFTSGRACLKTAGTAMYEALAASEDLINKCSQGIKHRISCIRLSYFLGAFA